jgi:GT2 family glycosyltransferase
LGEVTAEWFGWLDHDDQLDPRAIETVSQAVTADPGIDIVYSDEDKIDANGNHFELYCKPDFSPELLLSQMYLCHFTAFRTSLVREVGGFRSEMDGAQDFDLALRLLSLVTSVHHIPHPLYHWRSWAQSTAYSIDAKPWAQQSTARAQTEYLERTFGGGTVVASRVPGLNDVHPRITEPTPTVSVIIPTVGTRVSGHERLVDSAVRSLRQNEKLELQIIAVTTGTIDPIPGVDAQVVYTPADGFNFAEAINLGRGSATGEYLMLLNDDTTVATPNPITALLEIGQIEGVGVTGALLTYPDGRIQHAGIVLLPGGPTHVHISRPGKWPGYFGSTLTPRNYSAVTAAAMLVRSQVFDELGGFDPVFARDFNDVDFCLRAGEAGYRVAWSPYAHFIHHEGASIVRTKADSREHVHFTERWTAVLHRDPFYSPALNPMLPRIYEAL